MYRFLESLWQAIKVTFLELLSSVPNIIIAVLIFLIGRAIARGVAKVIRTILGKSGIDRLNEKFNEIDLVSKSNYEVKLSTILSQVVYYLLVFVFLVVAVDFLEMDAISKLLTDFIAFIPKIVSAVAMLMIGLLFADMLRKMVKTTFESLGVPSAGLISNFIFYFLLINIFLMAMRQAELMTEFLEDNISILFGGIVAAFAVAYGLAARPMMGNMLASYQRRSSIQEGMKMEIDGLRGTVEQVDNHTFSLRTDDGLTVIPMSKLLSTNYTILND